MVHCDGSLNYDRLLTLIWLLCRNTGTRILLVHDKCTIYYIQVATIHVRNSLHHSHIIQFKHAYFTYIYIYIYIYMYIYKGIGR